jgi:hypothetical protein
MSSTNDTAREVMIQAFEREYPAASRRKHEAGLVCVDAGRFERVMAAQARAETEYVEAVLSCIDTYAEYVLVDHDRKTMRVKLHERVREGLQPGDLDPIVGTAQEGQG